LHAIGARGFCTDADQHGLTIGAGATGATVQAIADVLRARYLGVDELTVGIGIRARFDTHSARGAVAADRLRGDSHQRRGDDGGIGLRRKVGAGLATAGSQSGRGAGHGGNEQTTDRTDQMKAARARMAKGVNLVVDVARAQAEDLTSEHDSLWCERLAVVTSCCERVAPGWPFV